MRKHYPLNSAGAEDAGLLPWSDGVPNTGTEGSYPGHALMTDSEAELLAAQAVAGLVQNGQDLTQLAQAISRGAYLGAFSGTANALTAALPNNVAFPALLPGMRFSGVVTQPNTGPVTVALSGFGAPPGTINLLRRDGQPLQDGDLIVGLPFSIVYSGAVFIVGTPVRSETANDIWHTGIDTAGVADRIIAAVAPTITAYARGYQYRILAAHDCIGATVANFGGLGDRQVVRGDGTPLRAGDYLAGQVVDLADDGARLQLVGVLTANQPASNIVAFTVTPANGLWQPPTGVTKIKRTRLWGAGSGGGGSTGAVSAGTGGSGPGYAEATNLVIPAGGMLAITLGTPGAGGVNGDGTQGGTCSVGISGQAAWLTATAGAPGRWGNNTISSVASSGVGQGFGPGLNVPGGIGSLGINYGGAPGSGIGGPAPFGGGTPTPNVSIGGNDGLFPGGSGNGGCGGSNGGAGALPLLILEY